MNLRPADLLIELLLVPILTFVTLLHLVAGMRTEHRSVRVFMEIVLAGEYFCSYCSTEPRSSMDGSVPGLQIGWAPGNVAEQIR